MILLLDVVARFIFGDGKVICSILSSHMSSVQFTLVGCLRIILPNYVVIIRSKYIRIPIHQSV